MPNTLQRRTTSRMRPSSSTKAMPTANGPNRSQQEPLEASASLLPACCANRAPREAALPVFAPVALTRKETLTGIALAGLRKADHRREQAREQSLAALDGRDAFGGQFASRDRASPAAAAGSASYASPSRRR